MGWLIARLAEMAGVSVAVSADNTNEALAIAALENIVIAERPEFARVV